MPESAFQIEKIKSYLDQSPTTRAVIYLVGSALSFKLVQSGDRDNPFFWELTFLKTAPCIAALTFACARLSKDDHGWWKRRFPWHRKKQFIYGMGLGAGAFLIWASIAAAQGWISTPNWGWQLVSASTLVKSVVMLSIGHLAVAFYEELVFRGYTFDLLTKAQGVKLASGFLTALFILHHVPTPPNVINKIAGFLVGGAVLILARLWTDELWIPIGYHWMWNTMQTAVLGPAGSASTQPSVLPLEIDGPPIWVGSPGQPEPGLLSTLIHVGIAIGIGVAWWLRTHKKQQPVLGSGTTI